MSKNIFTQLKNKFISIVLTIYTLILDKLYYIESEDEVEKGSRTTIFQYITSKINSGFKYIGRQLFNIVITILSILKRIYAVIIKAYITVKLFISYVYTSFKNIIYNTYLYSKKSVINGYKYTLTELNNLKNYIIIKSYTTIQWLWKWYMYTLDLIYYSIINFGKLVITGFKKGINAVKITYKLSKQKAIQLGLYIVAGIFTIYNYIKLSGVVSTKILANTWDSVKEGTKDALESDESVISKWYHNLVSSIDSISYALLKFFYLAYKGKPYNEPLFDESGTINPQIQRWLDQANKSQTAEQYLARSVMFIVASAIIGAVGGGIIGALLAPIILNVELPFLAPVIPDMLVYAVEDYGVFAISGVSVILFGIMSTITVLSITYLSAWYQASSAERQININYNDAISHMYALVEGGADTKQLIYQMADTEETTGGVAIEFQKIINIIEYERENITSALQIQARRTPSEKMAELLSDLQTIQESGTSASSILESKHNEVLIEKDTKANNTEETLELLNEVMLNAGLLPVFLMILMMVQGLQGNVPTDMLNMLAYAAPYMILILFGMGMWVILQDDSTSEKTMDTYRTFNETHAHVYKVPDVIEDKLKSKKRNQNHMKDKRIGNILDSLYKRDYRREKYYKPMFDVRGRPLATIPYTVIIMLSYLIGVFVFVGLPSLESMTSHPFSSYMIYAIIPQTIIFIPLILVHRAKQKKESKIKNKIPVILDTAINSMKTGEDFEQSLRKTHTTSSTNIVGLLIKPFLQVMGKETNDKSDIENTLSKSWNNIQWKHDRIYALRKMANDFEVPRMTRTMKIITDSAEFTSDLVPVLQIEKMNIEKDMEVAKRIASAGIMAGIILIIVAFLTEGILALMDVTLIQTLQNAASGSGEAASSQAQSSSLGFNPDMFDIFRSRFIHLSINMAAVFGFLAGYMHKQSFITGATYGLILQYIAIGIYFGIVTVFA